ncbi:MAG TPA: GNAT family N-acetyltransferase [Gaiellaceae bacterium]|nr:GNAT family N-acetyltransferase [Gaiellaceae bacterium]
MRLETERLVLRRPRLEDAAAFYPHWQDPEAVEYVGGVKSRAEVDEMVERLLRHWEWYGLGEFTVERREDGAVLGRVGLQLWDPRDWTNGKRARLAGDVETELGWKLGREHWSSGYATEAALACRDWALADLGLKRLISLIAFENVASIRVAEKIGESFERDVDNVPFRHRYGLWSLGERMAA